MGKEIVSAQIEAEMLKKYLEYLESPQRLEEKRQDLFDSVVEFLRHKYKNAEIRLTGTNISIFGIDEDRASIAKDLKEIGII